VSTEVVQRSHDGKWLPGSSGNPGGRRRLPAELEQVRHETKMLATEFAPDAIRALHRIVTNPNASEMAAVRAAETILNRALGVPRPVDADTALNAPITFKFAMSDTIDAETIEDAEIVDLPEDARWHT
jgi:hypothetical protein